MKAPHPERIVAWRKKLGLTQNEAADLVGVGRRTYQGWELSEWCPPPMFEWVMRYFEMNGVAPTRRKP